MNPGATAFTVMFFPVVGLHAHGQAIAGDSGVVDQDIETAEFFEDLLEAAFHLLRIGYIHLYGKRRASGCGDIGNERGKSFFVARSNSHFCTHRGKCKRRVATDALRRASN